ncbi:hypothetical protein HNR53_002937 [Bacillus benzoevorans]|uniref:Uncharacterized protein n=1 Tax=Bacillus benzoevorans TaxID=1456 RepID=A0A7X0HSY5_9BACI|nr:hypothetical protein [Bacillus benzoevorans]
MPNEYAVSLKLNALCSKGMFILLYLKERKGKKQYPLSKSASIVQA